MECMQTREPNSNVRRSYIRWHILFMLIPTVKYSRWSNKLSFKKALLQKILYTSSSKMHMTQPNLGAKVVMVDFRLDVRVSGRPCKHWFCRCIGMFHVKFS